MAVSPAIRSAREEDDEKVRLRHVIKQIPCHKPNNFQIFFLPIKSNI
jgi:hypothetical protein